MNTLLTANCCVPGCTLTQGGIYGGKPYCRTHYREIFLSELSFEYESWVIDTPPGSRFLYLLGRASEEYGSATGGSYLSNARIRDRGFNFLKNSPGGTFQITRHLNAWSESKSMERIVETWMFNVETFEFSLLGKRDWTTSDPD